MPYLKFTAEVNHHPVQFSIQAPIINGDQARELIKDAEQLEQHLQREINSVHHIEYLDPVVYNEPLIEQDDPDDDDVLSVIGEYHERDDQL